MMSNRIAIISDLHIGNNKDSDKFHTIHLAYAHWLKGILREKNITNIVIAGDYFHNRNSISLLTLNTGHLFLDILKEFDITITSGNHCSYYLHNSDISSLSVFKTRKNVHIIDEHVTIMDNIVYCPWGTSIDQIPLDSNIVIGHWDVQSFLMSKGKISTHGLKASEIMNKCEIAFSGHYHTAQQRTYNNKTFYYLGSPMQLNYGESGNENYVHLLNTDTLEVEKIINDVSPRFHYINNENDLSLVKGNYVSISYTIGEQGEAWKRLVQSYEPLELKINAIREKVQQTDKVIENFQVIDIGETIKVWPVKNLNNLTEELKKRVATKAHNMYATLS